MSVNISLNRILVCLIIAGIAALVWWAVTVPLGGSMGVGLWMFGTVLLALNASVTVS